MFSPLRRRLIFERWVSVPQEYCEAAPLPSPEALGWDAKPEIFRCSAEQPTFLGV